MSGRDIIIDTNILLYFLDGDPNVNKFFFEYNPIISFVTELEILSAPELSQDEKSFIRELLKDITIVNYSERHKEDIVSVRLKKNLKLPDAIIASLAITLKLPLVTADKAFINVEKLNLIFYKTPGNN